ncbi:MAG: hypothetical protein IJH64_00430 [Oscillospiraceae bacterium]|nr:hypothetical protein [Oscillospiraceae bacterium]
MSKTAEAQRRYRARGGSAEISVKERINNAKDLKSLHDVLYNEYGITVKQNTLQGADFETVKQAAIGITTVIDEFPQAADYFHELNGDVTKSNAYAHATFYGQISINPTLFKSSESLQKQYDVDLRNEFHPKGTTSAHITSHEAGHVLEKALIDKYVIHPMGGAWERQAKVNAWNKHWQAQKVLSEAVKAVKKTPYGKGKKQADLFKAVSKYASTNRSETLAECVADYTANRGNANPLSIQVWNILKRELG